MMNKSVSKEKDSGLALVLIILITVLYTKIYVLIIPACIVLVLAMTIPVIFRPFSLIWFGLSDCIGKISSNIILSLLFLSIIFPVSIIRRLFKIDSLQLKLWGNGSETAFREKSHQYERSDLETPY